MIKQHVNYFDVLRVLAIVPVILMHVAMGEDYFNSLSVFSTNWEILNFWHSIAKWGVPIFVMISGALFLDPLREITLSKLYRKNIFHLVCALIFWSLFSTVIYGVYHGFDVQNSLRILIYPPALWFLYMIILLYILVPLLRTFCSNMKWVSYFVKISLVFSFLIPTLQKILAGLQLATQNSLVDMANSALTIVLGHMHFHFTLEYVAYFVLGLYLHKTSLGSWQRKSIYVLGILGALFTIGFSQYISQKVNYTWDIRYNMALNIFFQAVAIFVFIKYNAEKLSTRILAIFQFLAKRIFGIYLLHMSVLETIRYGLHIHIADYNPLWYVPIIAAVVFVLTLISAEIVRRIPFINKYII